MSLKLELPQVVVAFSKKQPEDAFDKAIAEGATLIEQRVDQFDVQDLDTLKDYLKSRQKYPLLLTIRAEKEGGRWSESEEVRLKFYEALIPFCRGVDVEINAGIAPQVISKAKKEKTFTIASYHNFEETPVKETLCNEIDKAKKLAPDFIKIATETPDLISMKRLMDLLVETDEKNLILLGMGDMGVITRAFFPMLGSCFTYAYTGKALVPGQLPIQKQVDVLDSLKSES